MHWASYLAKGITSIQAYAVLQPTGLVSSPCVCTVVRPPWPCLSALTAGVFLSVVTGLPAETCSVGLCICYWYLMSCLSNCSSCCCAYHDHMQVDIQYLGSMTATSRLTCITFLHVACATTPVWGFRATSQGSAVLIVCYNVTVIQTFLGSPPCTPLLALWRRSGC